MALKMMQTLLVVQLTVKLSIAMNTILLDGQMGKTQIYTPGAQSNPMTPNFGLPNLYGSVAVMFNGLAYFIGGEIISFFDKVTVFDPSTNTTSIGSTLKHARAYHKATIVNDTIIVCGGVNDTSILSSCEQFNETTQEWYEIASLPKPITYFAMATLNNHAYVYGGYIANTGDRCGDTAHVYMYNGSTWKTLNAMLNSLRQHVALVLDNNRALICGGISSKDGTCHTTSDCYLYTASNDSWQIMPNMAQNRSQHSMLLFNRRFNSNINYHKV
jgi:N-acetylneuraminic acid mutarotase